MAPLLGPMGGGLAALAGGASPSAAAGGGGGGGAASSAALTTSLRAVFLEGNITMLIVRGVVVFEETSLAVSRNSDAADAMPQLAMVCL